jgi:hypothetical protein
MISHFKVRGKATAPSYSIQFCLVWRKPKNLFLLFTVCSFLLLRCACCVLLPQLLLLCGRAHAKSWMISGASRPKSTLLLLSSNQEDIADACANLEDRQHHD